MILTTRDFNTANFFVSWKRFGTIRARHLPPSKLDETSSRLLLVAEGNWLLVPQEKNVSNVLLPLIENTSLLGPKCDLKLR